MPEDAAISDPRSALYAIDRRMVELWREGAWFVAGWTLDKEDLIVAMAQISDLPQIGRAHV